MTIDSLINPNITYCYVIEKVLAAPHSFAVISNLYVCISLYYIEEPYRESKTGMTWNDCIWIGHLTNLGNYIKQAVALCSIH